jgi:hypothetical protein
MHPPVAKKKSQSPHFLISPDLFTHKNQPIRAPHPGAWKGRSMWPNVCEISARNEIFQSELWQK